MKRFSSLACVIAVQAFVFVHFSFSAASNSSWAQKYSSLLELEGAGSFAVAAELGKIQNDSTTTMLCSHQFTEADAVSTFIKTLEQQAAAPVTILSRVCCAYETISTAAKNYISPEIITANECDALAPLLRHLALSELVLSNSEKTKQKVVANFQTNKLLWHDAVKNLKLSGHAHLKQQLFLKNIELFKNNELSLFNTPWWHSIENSWNVNVSKTLMSQLAFAIFKNSALQLLSLPSGDQECLSKEFLDMSRNLNQLARFLTEYEFKKDSNGKPKQAYIPLQFVSDAQPLNVVTAAAVCKTALFNKFDFYEKQFLLKQMYQNKKMLQILLGFFVAPLQKALLKNKEPQFVLLESYDKLHQDKIDVNEGTPLVQKKSPELTGTLQAWNSTLNLKFATEEFTALLAQELVDGVGILQSYNQQAHLYAGFVQSENGLEQSEAFKFYKNNSDEHLRKLADAFNETAVVKTDFLNAQQEADEVLKAERDLAVAIGAAEWQPSKSAQHSYFALPDAARPEQPVKIDEALEKLREELKIEFLD